MAVSFEGSGAELETTNSDWTNVTAVEIQPGETVVVIRAGAFARRSDNTDCATWQKTLLLRRDGSNPLAVVGSAVDIISPIKTLGAALWDFRVVVNENNTHINFDVKGAASNDVGWILFGDGLIMDYPS